MSLPPHTARRPVGQRKAIPPSEQQADDIGERVPADRDGSDRDRDRVYGGKRDGENGIGADPTWSGRERAGSRAVIGGAPRREQAGGEQSRTTRTSGRIRITGGAAGETPSGTGSPTDGSSSPRLSFASNAGLHSGGGGGT